MPNTPMRPANVGLDGELLRTLAPEGAPELKKFKRRYRPWELWWPSTEGGTVLVRKYPSRKAALAEADMMPFMIRAAREEAEPALAIAPVGEVLHQEEQRPETWSPTILIALAVGVLILAIPFIIWIAYS
jgi:hypothetical protein